MKRLVVLLPFLLAGCMTVSNPVTPTTVYQLRALYDATVLAPAANYRRLPLCEAAQPPCAERAVIVKLQAADRLAVASLDAAQAFVTANPTLNPLSVISAAQAAVNAMLQLETTYGIH